jgi:glycerophosphoryl diester phosphodiesterase
MIILSHRGWWKKTEEKNTRIAFQRAFDAGYGIETDIRDQNGTLAVSHDPPIGSCMPWAEFVEIWQKSNPDAVIAVNIKADGLQSRFAVSMSTINPKSYFVFDMSVPDSLGYLNASIPTFGRLSEYEPQLYKTDQLTGVWIDCFKSDWIDAAVIEKNRVLGLDVALVSPECHKRGHSEAWKEWRKALISPSDSGRLMICTDFPDQADAFFNNHAKN